MQHPWFLNLRYFVELDKFLNSKQRIYEAELAEEDYRLISKLMHHVMKIKCAQKGNIVEEWYRSLSSNNLLEKTSLSYSVPLKDDYPKLEGTGHNLVNRTNLYSTRTSSNYKVVTGEPFMPPPSFAYSVPIDHSIEEDSKLEIKRLNTSPQICEFKKDSKPSQKMFQRVSIPKGNKKKVEPSTEPNRSSWESESLLSHKTPPQSENPKSKQSLSLRTDVMNKNLFRAIRRECKSMFETFISSNNLIVSKKQKHFVSNLEQFTEHLLSVTNVDWEGDTEFNTKEFSTYVGIFANYWAMKKILRNESTKDKLEKVYSVLYSYSHVKFNEFMSIPEIRTLVKVICERSGKESLIVGNTTLCANKERYESHINKLLRSFN